jgi:hypothetical protein
MSIYPPPNWVEELSTFNSSNYGQSVETSGVSTAFLDANYVKFPVAQGEVTFTNTSNTGNMTVQGNLLTNTITGTTTTSTISLFPSITTTDISLGAGLTTGSTLKIGSSTNSNHLGLVDFTGNTINNTVPATGSLSICNTQTSGTLSIGSGASRTGAINIGNGSGATSTITVGASGSTVNLNGSTVSVNSISLIPSSATSSSNLALADNLPQNYFVNMVNAGTARTVTLPINPYTGQKITIINRSALSINTIAVGNTGTQTIQGYGVSATSFSNYIGQSVIIQWTDLTRNFWVLQYKSNETYQPIVPNYPTTTLFTELTQIGYTYTQSATQSIITVAGNYAYSMQITASPFPVGLYNVVIRAVLTNGTGTNTFSTVVTSLSTTTTSSGAITGLLKRDFPIATSITSGVIVNCNVNGPYTRSAVETVYATLSFSNTVYASTGITPTLSCSITRIA